MSILEDCNVSDIIKITASKPMDKSVEFLRVVLTRVIIKNSECFQAEKFQGNQVFHSNISVDNLKNYLDDNIAERYKQICIVLPNKTVTYLYSSSGKVKRIENNIKTTQKSNLSQNRRKKYLLNEGDDIPVLVDLGIFTKDFKVVNSKFDKFKQINRFVEILDDVFKNCDKQDLTLLDFGCGKSYLTFVIYYYLVTIRKINAKIIGYDLKSDVVAECNKLAQKYGYDNLRFVVADVSRDRLYDEKIDAVVSLHACDTATDYALYYAITHDVKYIFSVPCCQHEINSSIVKGGDLDVLLKYGIIKERVSALLTDSIRAMLLDDEGYSVDVMEFVDFAHSPKNIMLRAVKTRGKSNKNSETVFDLMRKYGFEQTLYKLLNGLN